MTKPFSQACENNKHPILKVLTRVLAQKKHLLEVGSGTGQHAVHFAQNLPFLTWQTSDLPMNHAGINLWIDELPSANIIRPITLDLAKTKPFPEKVDAIFTANTLHIISWSLVKNLFDFIKVQLSAKGVLCIYGPFNYQGSFSSESNANFEVWLKDRDINSGIRDFEAVCKLATSADLTLIEDIEMPANNRLLVFNKH
jgi:cyclopropane fatty-acyl-phospholipid synthase-like methyltransferase